VGVQQVTFKTASHRSNGYLRERNDFGQGAVTVPTSHV